MSLHDVDRLPGLALVPGPGLALGLAAALVSGGVLSTQLYGVSPRDPGVYASVPGVLAAAALAAAWLPARRATRIDRSRAVRAEQGRAAPTARLRCVGAQPRLRHGDCVSSVTTRVTPTTGAGS